MIITEKLSTIKINPTPAFIFNVDFKGLSNTEIQKAVNEYITNSNELIKESLRLNKFVDELMNENKYYRKGNYDLKSENEKLAEDNIKLKEFYDYWMERFNGD